MPAEDGVGRHERHDLLEQTSPQPISPHGETPAVVIVETQALPAKLDLQASVDTQNRPLMDS
jgi:hypothetical protein